MNALLIIGLIVVIAIIVVIIYFTYESSGVSYSTTLNNVVLYQGSTRPYVSSDDFNRVAITRGDKVDLFDENGNKLGTVTITGATITGIAFNKTENRFMVLDSQGNLYEIDDASFTASQVSTGYSSIYDTVSGYYAKKDTIELVMGNTNDKNPINGDYGLFEIRTKVVR